MLIAIKGIMFLLISLVHSVHLLGDDLSNLTRVGHLKQAEVKGFFMGDTVEENYNTGGFAMKNTPVILGVLLLAGILATPATAFSINTLAVNLLENGDAEVTVDYSLSWRERFAVYTRIAHPEQDLESALVSFSGRDIRIESVSPARTELRIEGFADIAKDETGTTYTTPAMDFSMAEQKVRGYWLSRFITLDLSPARTVISFPDGYEASFTDLAYIPSVSHMVT